MGAVRVDVTVESQLSDSVRAQQVSAAFDVPPRDHAALTWTGDLPLDERDWQIGLIVGPSGSGKTTVLRHAFGDPVEHEWGAASVIDDFPSDVTVEDIMAVCGAVGFNTIPAWLRPYAVLSNGEQFRVGLARLLLSAREGATVTVDEFTSVVDRQVARIGAHAVQKYVRRGDTRFVAATCHYDVIDWLQPDWTLEPDTMKFTWRCLQQRPGVVCDIRRVSIDEYWPTFAPFHYLTASLNRGAKCFVLFVEGRTPAAFAGVLHRPHSNPNVKGLSRLVTLPDWQGLGLAFALADRVAGAYHAYGYDFHAYPAHPNLIRSFDRSRVWQITKHPGVIRSIGHTSKFNRSKAGDRWEQGTRPNAVFKYAGPPLPRADAMVLLADVPFAKRPRRRVRPR